MPIQPSGALGVKGSIELLPQYQPALLDLNGFSHIYLIYHFHKVQGVTLQPIPFLDTKPHGLFATRAPKRPNPIGISIVKLISIDQNVLTIENVDILDGTPLLDIKPYIPEFNQIDEVKIGWLKDSAQNVKDRRSDQRFK